MLFPMSFPLASQKSGIKEIARDATTPQDRNGIIQGYRVRTEHLGKVSRPMRATTGNGGVFWGHGRGIDG